VGQALGPPGSFSHRLNLSNQKSDKSTEPALSQRARQTVPLNGSDYRHRAALLVGMRLTVVIWLVTGIVEAQRHGPPGHRWASGWFWAGLIALVSATATLAWRERGHLAREGALERAVRERTSDLDLEKRREQERNHILEMLVSNEPLGTVLDAIPGSLRAQCGDIACVVLIRRGDGCQTVAAVSTPAEWLSALRSSHTVPFEVWRQPVRTVDMAAEPAWNRFVSSLDRSAPSAAICRPIRSAQGQPAAIVILFRGDQKPAAQDERAAEVAQRLARLAIEQSRLYDSLHFQAHHDSLTQLPNRLLFEERLERSVHEAAVVNRRIAVVFVDLDLFKRVNDTYSHRIGDLFLCEIADRMRKAIRPSDLVARIGGDEFTILLTDLQDAAEASEIAARVLESIRLSVYVDGHEIASSASAGIAIFPEDGNDAEKLQRAADAAMYCAKDSGRDRAETFSTRNEVLDRVRMDEELRVALRENYFVVHYQPKVGANRRPAGFEALVRMNHPVLGYVQPMSFIPVAESNGLIVPIGAWVLDEVCRQIASWESRGLDPVSVAVNVSPVQICRGDYAKSVAACLARHGVDPSRLEIELTESLMINAGGAAKDQLYALRSLGVRLSIDDFGTGYSSLSYLHKLPIDAIKLDKSFVQSIDTDHLAHRLVHAMIGVAAGLGLKVVAEGVETEEQRKVLVEAGCELMQGYLFSRPHPAGELDDFLQPYVRSAVAGISHDLLQLAGSTAGGKGVEAAVMPT
jgi:diguanylate cyclase (GGDEF)-like protein